MVEILPNGTMQGYYNICKTCGETIEVNYQGSPINHECNTTKLVCRVCKSNKLHDFGVMIQCQKCGAIQ